MPAPQRRHFGSVRKLPSARYQARYWHAGARHVAPDTFATKADALAWLSRSDADIGRAEWLDPAAGKATFAEVAARWLAGDALKRGSTRARDQSILTVHVLPVLGGQQVVRVTQVDVQRLVDGWARDHTPSTVRRMFAVVRGVFSFAVASDLLGRSPCAAVRLPRGGLVDRPVLSAGQLEALAEALGPSQAPMMWLGVVGGLRWAECAGLAVGGLDLLHRSVSVSEQLGRDGRIGPPKSRAGVRRLSIPAWLAEDLAALLAARSLTATDARELVFVSEEGRPLHYSNWRRRTWGPACKTAGLPELRFHDLRSMAATALVAAGIDIKTAQVRLGHSSPAVTLGIYARATEQADRLAADALSKYLAPSRAESGTGQRPTALSP